MTAEPLEAPAAPPFRFDVISAADLAKHPAELERVWSRAVDGLVVRDVLSEQTRRTVLERLERRTPDLRRRIIEHREDGTEPPYVMSGGLITSPPDLTAYFADSAHFRAGCRELFAGTQDFEARFTEVVTAMSAGIPASVPSGPRGESYSPATIRVLPSGREITLHCGNDFLHRPECTHMRELVDNTTQLSYFVPLQLPRSGGELELYDVAWGDTDGEKRVDGIPVSIIVTLSRKMMAPVGEGDLLVFDGGRIYHRVTKVGAGERRVTIGGFLGYTPDHRTLYFWS